MIVGVGIDVVDVQRLVAALHRSPRLRERLFVPDERSMPETSLAARFATKEALAKALGAPMGLHWHDAVVRRVAGTQPVIEVKGTVAARAAAPASVYGASVPSQRPGAAMPTAFTRQALGA